MLENEHTSNKIMEIEDKLLRMHAEFENYKKRSVRENEMIREAIMADSVLKIIPIVDEFEIALAHMEKREKNDESHDGKESGEKEFGKGMKMIYSKLLAVLKKDGVEPMNAVGETFDPYKHDAMRQADGPEGKVLEVIQKGYMFKGKVLRHAKVAVGNGNQPKP